jgi:hypothetical protein
MAIVVVLFEGGERCSQMLLRAVVMRVSSRHGLGARVPS